MAGLFSVIEPIGMEAVRMYITVALYPVVVQIAILIESFFPITFVTEWEIITRTIISQRPSVITIIKVKSEMKSIVSSKIAPIHPRPISIILITWI
jgi:hypothetical protein